MDYQELLFAAAVQRAAVVNRNRALDEELKNNAHVHGVDIVTGNFNLARPLEAFMVGAYREIMEARDVVAELVRQEREARNAEPHPPLQRPTYFVDPV